MSIYRAKHRGNGLETLLLRAEAPLNRRQSAALGAAVGVLIGALLVACLMA